MKLNMRKRERKEQKESERESREKKCRIVIGIGNFPSVVFRFTFHRLSELSRRRNKIDLRRLKNYVFLPFLLRLAKYVFYNVSKKEEEGVVEQKKKLQKRRRGNKVTIQNINIHRFLYIFRFLPCLQSQSEKHKDELNSNCSRLYATYQRKRHSIKWHKD